MSQIHALLSKLRSLGYFIALGMRLTYELFLKGMNFLLQKNKNDELSRIAGELSIQGDQNEAEDDLLNLMDSAWWEEYCIMGKMEWPAGPDLCNIFVSVIFLFVVHCHEFRMKATFFFVVIFGHRIWFIYCYKPVTFSVNSVELLGFSTSDKFNKSDFHLFF